jgi:hypothetical protein
MCPYYFFNLLIATVSETGRLGSKAKDGLGSKKGPVRELKPGS